MRSRLSPGKVALGGVLAALVFASDGVAGQKHVTVALTATRPSPSTIKKGEADVLDFVNTDSVSHTVYFTGGHCTLVVPPGPPAVVGEYASCQSRPGTYHYLVDDRYRGTVVVTGLFRAVTLTARTHAIRLGGRVELHGKLTVANSGAPFCSPYRGVLLLLARHARSKRFKRIAMFPVTAPPDRKAAVADRCSYAWQRDVEPELSTTYVAQTLGGLYLWRADRSRPVTVQVRP